MVLLTFSSIDPMEQDVLCMNMEHGAENEKPQNAWQVISGALSWPSLKELYDLGHKDELKKMIKCADNIDLYDDEGVAALLHYAAGNGYKRIVSWLLDLKADIDIVVARRYYKGSTPLFFASKYGHYSVVALLISRGANIDQKNKMGETPLAAAVKNGFCRIVDILLAHNAHPNICDKFKMTPLHYACERDGQEYKTIAEYLLDYGALLTNDIYGKTPLFYAARRSSQITQFLLERGAPWNISDYNGTTVLHEALEYSHNEALRIFLMCQTVSEDDDKKKIVKKNPDKLAHKQAKKFFKEIKKLLEMRNVYDRTPFEEAHFHDNKEAIQLLERFQETRKFDMMERTIKNCILENIKKRCQK